MEANRSPFRVVSWLVATLALAAPLLGGCAEFFPRPQATPQRSRPSDAEIVRNAPARPMESVESASSQPAGDVESQVQAWLAGLPQRDRSAEAESGIASRARTTDGDFPPPVKPAAPEPPGEDAADAQLIASQEPGAESADSTAGVADEPSAPAGPPVVTAVSVRPAARAPQFPAVSPLEPTVANAARTSASAAPSMDELLRLHAAQLADVGFREQLDRRLLLALAGDFESARQPLDAVSDEQQRIAAQFIESLIAMREFHGGDPQAEADKLRAQVDRLHETLRATGDPVLSAPALCRSVRGFGQYDLLDPPLVFAGVESEFIAYVEVRDFASEELPSGEFESRFALRTSILSRGGETILELTDDPVVDRCRSRRRDCFIPRLLRLPASLSPGEYVVKVSLTDKIAQRVTEQRTTFRVVVRP